MAAEDDYSSGSENNDEYLSDEEYFYTEYGRCKLTNSPTMRKLYLHVSYIRIDDVMASAEQDSGPEVIDNDRQFKAFQNKN